jgi:HAMP domain-containing protein
MTEITRDLASGEYTQRVQIASQDEVGQLGKAFNRMRTACNASSNYGGVW